MLESAFNEAAGLQLFCEYCKILLVAASAKFINFPRKPQWCRPDRFIFLRDMTDYNSMLIS